MNLYYLSAASLSAAITLVAGQWLIPILRRLKLGQTILDIGPAWHKSKEGTPTMGGLMFVAGISVSAALVFSAAVYKMPHLALGAGRLAPGRFVSGLCAAAAFSLTGLWDDYVKVAKKQNLGLTARQKLALQFLSAGAFLWMLATQGDRSTTFIIPFLGTWNAGVFYYPLCLLGIVFVVNSVNITDGIDALAASVTAVCAMGFFVSSVILGYYLNAVFCASAAGGTLAFLVYNAHPAKVFMGDTGSMFLGGAVIAMAFGAGIPVFIALAGIVYVLESLSVVAQVISFKTTGRRIFKMSPIHHHYEMKGLGERQIVFYFTALAAAGSIACIAAAALLGQP